jgi:hypothetical protein
MCNAKLMFSLFPSPNGRNQILTMENMRQNYSPVYVTGGVFGWGSGRNKILDLMATHLP